MARSEYVEFKPSHRGAPAGRRHADVAADEAIEVSVYLKPRGKQDASTPAEMTARRAGAHADDIKLIEAFAAAARLSVVAVEPGRRLIRLAGSAARMQAAFKTELGVYHDGKAQFRGRSGSLSMPADVAAVVESVLGLDTRPAASPRRVLPRAAVAGARFLPNKVAQLYKFPAGVTGAGQCIGLIELGGGFLQADTDAAFQAMGLASPVVVAVPVDGGANAPTPDDGADGEVALDIQVAGGAAPGAKIAVYFAPNTDAGFVDAVGAASHDSANRPSVISISWGGPESGWSAQAQASMTSALQDAANLGISVFVASGDNLATDGVSDGAAHVDFPASSPWAIGCGGTSIEVAGDAISRESVWNNGNAGTGGGVSAVYPVPDFQAAAKLPLAFGTGAVGRGVPDVAGDADPNTGYIVVVNGQSQVVGGTSAVAPLWAGLAALINEKAAAPIGFFLPKLYAATGLTNDVTVGNNKPTGSDAGYPAGPGWDACTGLGSPNGQALFEALTGPVGVS
jgi:kumamolisin